MLSEVIGAEPPLSSVMAPSLGFAPPSAELGLAPRSSPRSGGRDSHASPIGVARCLPSAHRRAADRARSRTPPRWLTGPTSGAWPPARRPRKRPRRLLRVAAAPPAQSNRDSSVLVHSHKQSAKSPHGRGGCVRRAYIAARHQL